MTTAPQTTQQRMADTLRQVGLPYKGINVYGRQIVVTSHCRDTAEKWAGVLAQFAQIRAVVPAIDYAQDNKKTVMRPSTVRVWRTFARV